MAEPNDDPLLREIEEELRQEQAKKLWAKYGNFVIAVALLIVVGVAGYQGWQAYDLSVKQEATDKLIGASGLVEQGDLDAAVTVFGEIEADTPGAIGVIAALQRAAILAEQGDAESAAAAYMAIANEGGTPKAFQDLARILGASQTLDARPDEAASVIEELSALAQPTSSWRHSAREISAIAATISGDNDRAIEFLQAIALDPEAPGGVRSRAEELLQVIDN